ncbi:MAG: hypothetical protein ACREXW_17145 [Gammaproteobacteria bacterium]
MSCQHAIRGENGELQTGSQRLNWVWYCNTDEELELHELLRDRHGRSHRSSVPAGEVRQHVAALRQRAAEHLPGVLAKLVQATPEPFIQVIYDLRSSAMS